MKLIIQVATATLGDMIVEEGDEKTTTNIDDQKAIVVELLIQAIEKITAAYKIPKEMLDLGDEEYQSAHKRKIEQDREPRTSSAEINRQARAVLEMAQKLVDTKEVVDTIPEGGVPGEEKDGEELDLTPEEFEFVKGILNVMRGKNNV